MRAGRTPCLVFNRYAQKVGTFDHVARRGRLVFLAALTVIGAWLRFSAIGFGLPDLFRPDEGWIIPSALDFEHNWDPYVWNPHVAVYPAAQIYLIHAVLRLYAALTGAGANLWVAFGSGHTPQAYLIGRLITAAMGVATVPAIYLAAVPAFGSTAGLVSAAITTVSYIHVRESKFAKLEVPAGLWLALCIWMMLRTANRGRRMDYSLAGFFCGLAAATHYSAGAIAAGIFVAHLEARHREGKRLLTSLLDTRIYLAGIVAILSFLCANPYFILDWRRTVDEFALQRKAYWRWSGDKYDFGWRWLFLRAMPRGFGIEFEVFMLAALLWNLFRPRPGTYSLMAFILICFLTLTNGRPMLEYRYLVNPLIAMALLSGVLATDLTTLVRAWMGNGAVYLMVLVGTILCVPSLVRDVEANHLLDRPDTRTLARTWILEHIPAEDRIIFIPGSGFGKPDIQERYHVVSVESPKSLQVDTKMANWVIVDSFPPLNKWSPGVTDAEMDLLNSEGKVVFDIDPLKPGGGIPTFDRNDAFYAPFTHITSMMRPGPKIRIWKIERASPASK